MTAHPEWCDRWCCTADGDTGAHRSLGVAVDRHTAIFGNLYAVAAQPDVIFVEVRCDQRLLSARAAFAVGRMITSLGNVAEDGSRSDG